ncbi:MAG: hypothetical protein KF819_33160 [Labilithrix sp.]|nr:hypothetical protein [Labilithrix sp.]
MRSLLASSRRILPAIALVALAACVPGCAAETDEDFPEVEQSADAITAAEKTCAGWESVGLGISYRNTGDGDGIFIAYGGYSVHGTWSCAWSEALHAARLEGLGVGHIFAVKGPRDVGYNAAEVGNSKLAARLVAGGEGGLAGKAPFILIAAHSSGAYVAHELLNQLYNPSRPVDAADLTNRKIVYANLDGGGGLSSRVIGKLRRVAFVWAEDTTLRAGRSSNWSTMVALGSANGNTALRIQTDRTTCNSGAKWCLHDAVITTKPHDPNRFDLARDYTNFVGRPVQTKWVDALATHLR